MLPRRGTNLTRPWQHIWPEEHNPPAKLLRTEKSIGRPRVYCVSARHRDPRSASQDGFGGHEHGGIDDGLLSGRLVAWLLGTPPADSQATLAGCLN